MSPQERRRQLLGIGLSKLVERPIQDLSVDEVAREAGISRGLLFHYFPSKTAYHEEVTAAAVRRVMRNTAPDEGVTGEEGLAQFVRRFFAQVERRREFYLALVFGSGVVSLGGDRVDSLRMTIAQRVVATLGLEESAEGTVHAWAAYVEDRALRWSAPPPAERTRGLDTEVRHCVAALRALLAVD